MLRAPRWDAGPATGNLLDAVPDGPAQGCAQQLYISCDSIQHPCKVWDTDTLNHMRAEQELLDMEICARDQSGAWVSVRVHTLIMVRAHACPHAWCVGMHSGPAERWTAP